jgi:hypothetical protein
MHYDKFAINTADVNEFRRLAQEDGLPHRVMQVGRSLLFPQDSR